MLPKRLYLCTPKFENPQILMSSLRSETLLLCSATNSQISKPHQTMSQCVDAPEMDTITQSLGFLQRINALTYTVKSNGKIPKTKVELTPFGQLLANLPLELDASRLVIAGALEGLLRPCVVLAAILSTSPHPIIKPFGAGKSFKFRQTLERYGGRPITEEDLAEGQEKETVAEDPADTLLANLSAYEFWCREWQDVKRLKTLCNVDDLSVEVNWDGTEKAMSEWCQQHQLTPLSTVGVQETIENVMGIFHQFHPSFLNDPNNLGIKHIYQPSSLHSCQGLDHSEICLQKVYLAPSWFLEPSEIETIKGLLKVMRHQGLEEVLSVAMQPSADATPEPSELRGRAAREPERPVCAYFQKGICSKGDSCRFRHVLQSENERPLCNFFNSVTGCHKGAQCIYAHVVDPSVAVLASKASDIRLTEYEKMDKVSPDQLYNSGDGVLLLGEGNMSLAAKITRKPGVKVVATSLLSRYEFIERHMSGGENLYRIESSGHAAFFGIDARCLSPDLIAGANNVAWYFPLDESSDDLSIQQELIAGFFRSLSAAVLVLLKGSAPGSASDKMAPKLRLALQGDQFSRWRVHSMSQANFWFLEGRHAVDMSQHPYQLRSSEDREFKVERPILYSFSFRLSPSLTNLLHSF